MTHDPKLKEAAAEIKAVLAKHDIAGAVALVSETHSEFVIRPDPSWSAAYIDGQQIRVRVKEKDFSTREECVRVCNLTAHMIMTMKDLAALWFGNFQRIEDMLREHWDIEHTPYEGFEPHREQ